MVRVIGSFEKSRVREIGGEIIELESSKSKGKQGLVRDIGRFVKPRDPEIGIPLYYKLSWKNHVDSIALKISKTIGLLSKLRHFGPH